MPKLVAAAIVLIVTVSVVLFAALASKADEAPVKLEARFWNIDDEATLYVGCNKRLRANLLERGTYRHGVAHNAVVTVQVHNDRDGYSWGMRVKADGQEIFDSEDGHAKWYGARHNDQSRQFQRVFSKSWTLDGTPVATPPCLRTQTR